MGRIVYSPEKCGALSSASCRFSSCRASFRLGLKLKGAKMAKVISEGIETFSRHYPGVATISKDTVRNLNREVYGRR